MKLIVIVSDFGAAANVGGCVDTEAQIFDMPEEVEAYIRKSRTRWTSISLAFSSEVGPSYRDCSQQELFADSRGGEQ